MLEPTIGVLPSFLYASPHVCVFVRERVKMGALVAYVYIRVCVFVSVRDCMQVRALVVLENGRISFI